MKIVPFILLLLITTFAHASDYHQDDSTHMIVYTIVDTSGNHVTGETVRLTVRSWDSVNYYNFTDDTWGTFSTANSHKTLNEDATGGFYFYPMTIDSATLNSGDYVLIVSNESATYADVQAESVNFDNMGNLIRIHR